MGWIWLVLAGIGEMIGVAMITQLHRKRSIPVMIGLAAGFGLSVLFLTLALKTLPMATAYAIWTGIGTAGGALLGIILYKESTDWRRILCIALILASAVGLKFLS